MMAMERVLKLQTADGIIDVPVRIFAPVNEVESWQCHWEIEWPGRIRQNSAGGGDALQALVHAMQMVGIELYMSDAHRQGRLKWIGVDGGYGFPLTPNCRDLLEGDDAKFL